MKKIERLNSEKQKYESYYSQKENNSGFHSLFAGFTNSDGRK